VGVIDSTKRRGARDPHWGRRKLGTSASAHITDSTRTSRHVRNVPGPEVKRRALTAVPRAATTFSIRASRAYCLGPIPWSPQSDGARSTSRTRPCRLQSSIRRVAFRSLPSLRSAMLRVISFQPAGVLACRWRLSALTVRGRQKPEAHQPFNPRSRKMNFCSLPEAACGKCETKRQRCGTLW